MTPDQKRLFAAIDEMSRIRDAAIEAEQAGNREQADALWKQMAEFRTEHGLFDEVGSIDDEDDLPAPDPAVNESIALAMIDAQLEALTNGGDAEDEIRTMALMANEGDPGAEGEQD